MLRILDKVFGIDPAKIGADIAKNMLGDYAGDMVELAGDIKSDFTETMTSWGKTIGLIEDKSADLALEAERAFENMQPIIDKHRPTDGPVAPGDDVYVPFEPPEHKEPEPEMIELAELNQGEQVASNVLSELLHDLKETDGKIGTDFYNLENQDGLQNMLKVLKDEKWKNEMEMTPIDTALQAKMNAERANPMEMRSVQLESIISQESELSLSQEMTGTNVSPLDLDMYNRAASTDPPAIEMLEMRINLSDLPQPSNSEMSSIQPFQIETTEAMGQGSKPVGLEAFMDETYPEFNPDGQMLDDFVMADEMLDTTFSLIGAELGEWAGGLIMGTMDAIVGSAAGMALGAIYMSPIFAISELVPLVTQMANGHWQIPGYDRDMALVDHYTDELQTKLGKYYKLANEIEGFYSTNPTYVWFRDNGLAGGAYQRDSKVWGYGGMMNAYSWRGTVLSGTGLWKRGRILTVQGTAVGLVDDTKLGYWAFLKLGDDETIKTEIEPNKEVCIWFRIGMDGYMLPDTYQVRTVCTLYNLSLLNAMLPGYVPKLPGTAPPESDKPDDKPDLTPVALDDWGVHEDFIWNQDDVFFDHNWNVGDRVIYTFDVDGKKTKAHGVITTVDNDMYVLVKYDKATKIPWLKPGIEIMQTDIADIEPEPENWREEKDKKQKAEKAAEKAARLHDQYLFNQKYKHEHYHPGHRTKQDLRDYLGTLIEPEYIPVTDDTGGTTPPRSPKTSGIKYLTEQYLLNQKWKHDNYHPGHRTKQDLQDYLGNLIQPDYIPLSPPVVAPIVPKVIPIDPEPTYNPVVMWPFMQIDTVTPVNPKSDPVATVIDDTSAFNMMPGTRRRLPETIPPTPEQQPAGSEDESIVPGSEEGQGGSGQGATNMGRINQDKIKFWQTVEKAVDDIMSKPKDDKQFSFRQVQGYPQRVQLLKDEIAATMIEILTQGLESNEDMSEVQQSYLMDNYTDWEDLFDNMVNGMGDYENAVSLVMNVGFFPKRVSNVQALVRKLIPIEPEPVSSGKADNTGILILVGVIAVAYFMSN